MIETNNLIFLLILSQLLFFVGFLSFNYQIIIPNNFSKERIYKLYFSLVLLLIFSSSFIGYSYFFFQVNHTYIYGFLIFFIFYGLFYLTKFLFKNFNKLKIKSSYKYSILIYFLFFLLCISPPTDIDSIDYHLGAPATWYDYQSFYPRNDWLHYRFTGLGEYINIIGVYLKTFNFGQLIQFFSLIVVGLFGYKHIKKPENKKYFLLAALSCPLLLFLVSTQKYQLTAASIIFCSVIFISHRSKLSNLDIICIVGSLIFAVGSKFSYIIPCGLIWFYLAYKCYYFGKIKNLIIYSVISFVLILILPLYLKNYFFYGDPLSPILEEFKNNADQNIINFLNFNKTFALDFNNLEFIFHLFIPQRPSEFSTVLGIVPLFIFFLNFKKIDLISKKILVFILISVLFIFFSYRGMARYYLEFYFLICYVIFQNFDKVKYSKIFKLILHLQVLMMVIALLYSVYTLTPGIINKFYWSKVMNNNTFGYNLSQQVNKIIRAHHPGKNKKILLVGLRYYSLFSNDFVSDQYNRYVSDFNNYSIEDLSANENIDFILFEPTSLNLNYFNNCVSYSKKYEIETKYVYRNPFNNKTNSKIFFLILPSSYSC
tara:strand:- start:2225 stop:4018 length:1794 start_codon:yes stop_codon:yes gene_type:complete